MTILVMDGQGGRIGALLIEKLRAEGLGAEHKLLAVGTNALATAAMMRAGADQGATGENPVRVCAPRADIILGPMGILLADAMMGEITEAIAAAIARSPAEKVFLPLERCGVHVAGVEPLPIARLAELAARRVMALLHD